MKDYKLAKLAKLSNKHMNVFYKIPIIMLTTSAISWILLLTIGQNVKNLAAVFSVLINGFSVFFIIYLIIIVFIKLINH